MITGWHFARDDQRLAFDDGRKIIVGETLSISDDVKPEVGRVGLHAAEDILVALDFAAGNYLCRVEVWGDVHSRGDLVSGSHRRALWAIDATDVLRRWARWCALQVIDLWDAPDMVRQYLETGREDLRDGAREAAREAARAAVWATASATASAAAWAAAWDEPKDAAWAAARDAARDAQRSELLRLIAPNVVRHS